MTSLDDLYNQKQVRESTSPPAEGELAGKATQKPSRI